MSVLDRLHLKDDPHTNALAKMIFGITMREAFEQKICLSCKQPAIFDADDDRISYEIAALCTQCSIKASLTIEDTVMASIQQTTEKLRKHAIATVKFHDQNTGEAIDVRLVKLSICSCGYPLLNDKIKLGTPYKIWVEIVEELSYLCGGCGQERKKVQCVLASQYLDKTRHPAALPLELFDYKEG
jgi:hypothetical protein